MSFRLNSHVVTTETDDGMVLLNEHSGRYWQLNATGATVLNQLLDGEQPEQIAVNLAVSYQLDTDRAERDVAGVVSQLSAARLVETS